MEISSQSRFETAFLQIPVLLETRVTLPDWWFLTTAHVLLFAGLLQQTMWPLPVETLAAIGILLTGTIV